MTDNEITINALKKVLELMLCDGDLQRVSTVSHAIDLINRQKAEIERLKKEVRYWKDDAFKECMDREQLVNQTKAEASKEFAERLKSRVKGVGVHSAIDCVLEEMKTK